LYVAVANSVKTAYDTAISANTRAASAQSAAVSAYSNAVSYTDGLRLDSVTNTSITYVAVANSVKNAYDRAIDANTRATSAQSAAVSAYSNAVAYTDSLRLDSVTNTSITYVAVANSVKNAYDRAIDANTRATSAQSAAVSAYSNAVSYVNGLRVDSVISTSVTNIAVANSVKTAYDAAINANTNAINANTRAASAQSAAIDAYSNAVSYTNSLRLDSVTNTSVLYVAVANSVKTAYDAAINANTNAINANTRAASAQTQAENAYSNAVNILAPKASPTFTGTITLGNVSINTTAFFAGNSSVNAYVNSTGLYINGAAFPSGGGYYKGNAGAVGDTANKGNLFRINSNTMSQNITILAGENALTAGPIEINSGVTFEIQTNGRAAII
jgi:hypothetical protein